MHYVIRGLINAFRKMKGYNMIKEIKLPEISENVNEAEVVRILVKIGEPVQSEQALLELETQKAIFEIPSPEKGTVQEILVKEGETVTVGQVLIKLQQAGEPVKKEKKTPDQTRKNSAMPAPAEPERTRIKVPEQPSAVKKSDLTEMPQTSQKRAEKSMTEPVPAAPHVRRFARETGADIRKVRGSGPGGRISVDDVKAYIKRQLQGGTAGASILSRYTIPDLTRWGTVHREPMSKIRQVTAENMAQAWLNVPLVSQNDTADITELEEARKNLSQKIKEAGGHLTITAILVKVLASGVKLFPRFNAVPDLEKQEIIYRDYVHIGIAVDTERGLLVPVIQHADQKTLMEICQILPDLAEKARSKKLMPDALEGACMSLSNLGGFGVGHFTPLVSGPQVAILGVGGAKQIPVYREGQWVPRLLLPLTLSYDHRMIDGADGARFIRWIVEALENPFSMALEGGF
jgi:pyruvate dehydrogenase E2 component (dihydrolipoamide acetyltransferase)